MILWSSGCQNSHNSAVSSRPQELITCSRGKSVLVLQIQEQVVKIPAVVQQAIDHEIPEVQDLERVPRSCSLQWRNSCPTTKAKSFCTCSGQSFSSVAWTDSG